MVNPPCLPADFGASWEEFTQNWCLGEALEYSQTEVVRALDAIKRLWPEEVAKRAAGIWRGLLPVAGVVDLGRVLTDCEHVRGFREVLDRLKGGERSAYSEIVLVSSLVRLGYSPEFGAELNGKILDAHCDVEGQRIFFEAIAPERADQSIDAQQLTDQLSQSISGSISGCRIEVELFATLGPQIIQQIADAVRNADPGEWVMVDPVARVRRVNEGQKLLPLFDGEGASVVLAGECEVQGPSSGVVIRREDNDGRAKRLFNYEYHHFSEQVPNVLVVNTSAVIDGMKTWTNWMTRVLQPDRNRKVGAVVLFWQGFLGKAIRRWWKVIVNPHSYLAVPTTLVKGFESLDKSPA